MKRISLEDCVFVLVDVQGKLAQLMHDRDAFFSSLEKLTAGMLELKVPVIWMEQIPEKMGPTIEPLRKLLEGRQTVTKSAFSCCGAAAFTQALKATGRKTVLMAGMETHVCVYQTAVDLLEDHYRVEVVADAVSSRTAANRDAGLSRIRDAGGGLTTVEMLLMELMVTSEHPSFRNILKIIK